MEIIPVIDLLRGVVVRGVAGRRESYQPIQSRLVADSQPATVARAFVDKLGLRTVYIADLDAIAGQEPSWLLYDQIAAAGLALWIDAGITDPARAASLAQYARQQRQVSGVVVGLESIVESALLPELVDQIGAQQAIFSLDLLRGAPLLRPTAWPQPSSPQQLAASAHQAGFGRLIVLDLASVGVQAGPSTLELGRQLRQAFPELTLIGGGGVRQAADLLALAQAGYQGALVASALHDQQLTPHDLARFQSSPAHFTA